MVAVALVWTSSLQLDVMLANNGVTKLQTQIELHTNEYMRVVVGRKKVVDAKQKLAALKKLAAYRFLAGNLLNALQQTTVDGVQLLRIKVDQEYSGTLAVPPKTNDTRVIAGRPGTAKEKIIVLLDARDSSQNPGDQVNKFKEAVAGQSYFKGIVEQNERRSIEQFVGAANGRGWQNICVVHRGMQFHGAHPMKKLLIEKRIQLILIAFVTLAMLALIGFLIRTQFAALDKIAEEKKDAETKLQSIRNVIKGVDTTASELVELTNALSRAEEDMAVGDPYSWIYDTIRRLKTQHKVDIPEISRPAIEDEDMLPTFPYKQVRFNINGTAYYHDLGKFIADFENSFPHGRIANLTVESPGSDSKDEKLSFKMDIIALVKPNS